uniref:Reverse transcriptase domain-containing protein n=1 Tax=Tanacetum cinerariifolium TaxID=118510 RepID=A0A6L2J189_TANCI|nr:reverse transcriptase domain-containing protein [Tanacetum cinerariifolium]
MKANDAILKNMQTNMTSLTNSNLELKNMFGQFMKMIIASSSGLGTLPVERETEATKDTAHPTNNKSTKDVQPSVVQTETPIQNFEPVVAPIIEPIASPISAPKPNQRPSIPYPSRLHDQKLHDKANDQREKFFQIFKDLNFNISFADALILMPKFGPSIKSLLTNKDKLYELARTSLNEHCSAVLLKKLPEKLGDPDKFLIPYFDADPRVPLIHGRSFLKTGRALIDVFEGELTLRVGKEAITFNLDQTSRYPANYNDMTANRIDVIDMACEEYSQEVIGFSDVNVSGNPTPYYDPIVSITSSTLTQFGNSDFLLEEVDAFLALEDDPTSQEVDQSYVDTEGDIRILEAFLNDDPSLPPLNQGNYLPQVRKELKICEAKTDKSSIDEPPEVELNDLPPHLEYAFLEGDDKLPEDFEPAVQHQRRVNPEIYDFIKNEVLKLLNAILIYLIFDSPWVSPVQCVPKKGGLTLVENEENELILTRLVTGWHVCIDYRKLNEATQKNHFPLPFLDQILEISGKRVLLFSRRFSSYFQITIDLKDQEKTTFTCPYGTFAYRRMPFGLCNAPGTFQRYMMAIFHDMIEKTMEVFMDDFSVFRNSFQTCLSHLEKMLKLCEDTNLCLNWEKSHFMVKEGIVLDHIISKNGIEVDKAKVEIIAKLPHPTTIKGSTPLRVSFKVIDTKGAENLATDHLSRLENPHQNVLDPKEINESFPLETLNMVSSRGNSSTPWFFDFANYHAGNFVVKGMSSQQKNKFFKDVKHYFWDDPFFSKSMQIKSSESVYTARKPLTFLRLATIDPPRDIMAQTTLPRRFGTLRAIISDHETYFCNDQFAKVMLKFGVTHRLATPYHPQTSGQVKPGRLASRLGCAETKVVTWDDLAFKLITLGWNVKHKNFANR